MIKSLRVVVDEDVLGTSFYRYEVEVFNLGRKGSTVYTLTKDEVESIIKYLTRLYSSAVLLEKES